jgi:hypothetical protein
MIQELKAIVRMDWPLIAMLAMFTLLGIWCVVEPTGMIGWVRTAHPELRDDDPQLIFYVRFIGGCFIGLMAVIFLGILLSH